MLLDPQEGVHYPGSTGDFLAWFRSDVDCLDHLSWLRWPNGFVCPTYESTGGGWRLGDGRFVCSECGARTSVTAGTTTCPFVGQPEKLPGVHRATSLLKQWLLSTHQGSVDREHLPASTSSCSASTATPAAGAACFSSVHSRWPSLSSQCATATSYSARACRAGFPGPGDRAAIRPVWNGRPPTDPGDNPQTCAAPVKS